MSIPNEVIFYFLLSDEINTEGTQQKNLLIEMDLYKVRVGYGVEHHSFIRGGNRRKPPTCRKSLTDFTI